MFFTRGMSLEGWQRAGLLDRELALYRGLADDLDGLTFVTYGGPDDGRFAADVRHLDVLTNAWQMPSNLYSVLAPWLHRRHLRGASAFRTNQINGAWCGVVAKALFRKPLVVRCGFLWADNVSRLTPSRWRRVLSRALERLCVSSADHVVVACERDAATLAVRYDINRDRVTVIPNYVDTARFCPLPGVSPEPGRVTFVGRLEPEKNVRALIEAVSALPGVRLAIIGDGALRVELERQAHKAGAEVEFLGRVPHAELPALLNRSQAFVLPSHYEGNPKAILEAMACGVPVVGARVPGIVDVIVSGENGILCGTSSGDIRSALGQVLSDAPLRERLRAAGLAYVRNLCSLDAALASERKVLAAVMAAA